MLIVLSYMVSWWNSGINVMIQMDHGDIVGSFTKIFVDLAPVPLLLVFYFATVFSWIYFRIFVYSYEIIWGAAMQTRYVLDNNSIQQYIVIILLYSLLVLNIYWVFLFFKMFYIFAFQGKRADLQNKAGDDISVKKKIK